MFKSWADYPFPNKSVFSEQEEKFKLLLEKCFGIVVKQTMFIKGAKAQYHLYVWHDDNTVVSDVDQREMIASYFDCFNLHGEEYLETYLHLLNYRQKMISYAYGHAEVTIKETIRNRYAKTSVYLDYATNTFIIECGIDLVDKQDEIIRLCFKHLKEYDYYNFIVLNDVHIRIIKEGSDSTLNDIHLINREL